jgi:hypothetical protein
VSDLTLALRQRVVPPPQLGQLILLMSCSAVPIDRLLNGVEEAGLESEVQTRPSEG